MGCRAGRCISLGINPGQEGAFEAHEREAAQTMGPCGGRLERAIGNVEQVGDAPIDVHLVSFPDLARADSCASNPETPNLSSHRSEIAVRAAIL
jgi:uncharacterized protein (DUF1330 family)